VTSAGDHSNTQFATLALWIARRHGAGGEVREALRRVEERFRAAQAEDGSWSYQATVAIKAGAPPLPPAAPGRQPWGPVRSGGWARDGRRSWTGLDDGDLVPGFPGPGAFPQAPWPQPNPKPIKSKGVFCTSNTCAGLLALAVGHGIEPGRSHALGGNILNDHAIAAALRYLNKAIANVPGPKGQQGRLLDGMDDGYTLWSIERVGTLYGLKRIGSREWYPWAAEWLVGSQRPDGSWWDGCGPPIDTCFALLVLRRTNLAPDLTHALQGPQKSPSTPPPPRLKEGLPRDQGAQRGPTDPGTAPRGGLAVTPPPEPGVRRGLPDTGTAPKARDQKTP
jgi:hypothetical protein